MRRRGLVIATWIVVLVASLAASALLGDRFRNDFALPRTGSAAAEALLQRSFPEQAGDEAQLVVVVETGRLDDPSRVAAVDVVASTLQAQRYVGAVQPFAMARESGQIADDGRTAYLRVRMQPPAHDEIPISALHRIERAVRSSAPADLRVDFGGAPFQETGSQGFGPGEALGVAIAAAVLLVAFGSFMAALVPLLIALVAVGTGIAVIGLLSNVVSIAVFAPSLAALIGVGVGIDYALFIVSRHCGKLRSGASVEDAALEAARTSGRAVVLAGTTVCVALLGLFVVGIPFLYGTAIAAAIVVVLSVGASATLLPAFLAVVGRRVLGRRAGQRDASAGSAAWRRWAIGVGRHPARWGAAALVLLLVVGAPVLALRLGSADAGSDPEGSTTRAAYDALARAFGPGVNGPLAVVVDRPTGAAADAAVTIATRVAADRGVARADPPLVAPSGTVALVTVYPRHAPQDTATTDLIRRLRAHALPALDAELGTRTLVTGEAAVLEDFGAVIGDRLPLFMGSVIGLAFVLLLVVFRSIVIPVKASLMNVLATTAGCGAVVVVFQWGWLAPLVGVERTGPILAFLPVMLFAILFGLSMDYEVFLMSRIAEAWHRTGDNDAAIVQGQVETGRVITAAAAIMVAVFGSFVLGADPTIKLFGVGLAVSIFLDAVVVRTVLVPALMHLMGRWNWYLPSWLDRVLPPAPRRG